MRPTVLFITGSEADWGLLRPVVVLCAERFKVEVVMFGSHAESELELLELSATQYEVESVPGSKTPLFELYSAASAGMWSHLWDADKPDAAVVLGDRSEILAAVGALVCLGVPVHHLFAGDVSGCIDDRIRDGISVMATHLYCAGAPAFSRAQKMASISRRISSVNRVSLPEFVIDDSITPTEKFALMRFHPETLTDEPVHLWIQEMVQKAASQGIVLYVLPPNHDDGWERIEGAIQRAQENYPDTVRRISNMIREQYLGFLKHAQWVAGNSSSFIMEAPFLNSRVRIFGKRQEGRVTPDMANKDISISVCERIQTDASLAGSHK